MAADLQKVLLDAWANGLPFRHFPTLDNSADGVGALDVHLEDQTVVVEVNAPGITQEQMEVELNKDTSLLIAANLPARDEKASYLRRERPEGRFERRLTLPFPVDGEKVQASLAAGVLTIRLPRLASSLPRRIPVGQTAQS
jgi:HSP20 family protein